MNLIQISNIQKPVSIILLFSILFVFSCSNENAITNSNSLNKTNALADINSYDHENKGNDATANLLNAFERIWGKVEPIFEKSDINSQYVCFISFYVGYLLAGKPGWNPPSDFTTPLYDFRDQYLSKSEKGELYTKSYYLLSIYGIQNNLIMDYPLEHLSIMETGIEISKELQNGTNDNKILIDRAKYDDFKNLIRLYKNTENILDIDIAPVLGYLETDLEKYYNKPKAEIAADFGY